MGRLYEDAIEKCIKYEERQGEERPSNTLTKGRNRMRDRDTFTHLTFVE